MAFRKYAKALVPHPHFGMSEWGNFVSRIPGMRVASTQDGNLVAQASEILGEDFDPNKYLLSHSTIVASVDTRKVDGVTLGQTKEASTGDTITRKWDDYRITPETLGWINNNCFVPGTLVTMSDGTVKPIEEVDEGDLVLTHLGRPRRVLRKMVREVEEEVLSINGATATKEHPFYVEREGEFCFVEARALKESDLLQQWGSKSFTAVDLQKGPTKEYKGPVYNIEVEEDHSYIANGLAVHNCDAWSRPVLMKSYRTFVGGHNFLEHLQIEAQSKGRILDAVARDIGPSVYIDILVATHRKHAQLIKDIEEGRMGTLSMGCTTTHTTCTKCGNVAADENDLCFPPGTRVLLEGGTYIPIEEVVPGDRVYTHTGEVHEVAETMSRNFDGELISLMVEGIPSTIKSTPNHPFWVMRHAQECACGCGERLRRTVEHERGAVKAFKRRFLPGHNTRLLNPNPHASNVMELDAFRDLFEVNLEFCRADELQVGDFLSFPIPQEKEESKDATISKARLIGYFLAEGCFIKRGGERVGVSFSFGHHEFETLAKEVEGLLNETFGRPERRVESLDWETLVHQNRVKPIRRRATSREVHSKVMCPTCGAPSRYAYNARFSPGRDDCYLCKVCGRSWIQEADRSVRAHRFRPSNSTETSGSVDVRMMSKEVADFFYKYCGEYSHQKRLAAETLRWDPEIQRHILFGWLGGDGTQNHQGIRGSSASFHLVSQMHVMAARCGFHAGRSIIFGGKTADLNVAVNSQGEARRDSRGWLPSFALTIAEPKGFTKEHRFEDVERVRAKMGGIFNAFKRVGNWLVYRIREISVEPYSGPVFNFEVEKDHSYIVEGVAVHNCTHIRYMKGNTFYDERGIPCKVAELCGHESEDPTGGVHFIEASWVATPAFPGAVLRNMIQPEVIDLDRMKKVLDTPPPQWAADQTMKAAHSTRPRFVKGFDFEDDDGNGEDQPKKTQDSLETLQDEVEQTILDRVKKRIKEKLQKDLQEEASKPEGELGTATNQGITHDASLKEASLYQRGVGVILKTAKDDAMMLSQFGLHNLNFGIYIEPRIYRASLQVGPTAKYGSVAEYLDRCREAVQGDLTTGEAKTLIRLGHLLSLRTKRSEH